ncbi:Hypothetical predicted protein [Paramuricea clavata]|uniref:Uncharacterized protein n=1 Tax=Paramuricea clavata TaxID=317549 RepID=A0A7D9DYK2_PARCT|nr:Hypothetical predicted protein [Paramuricea clavata]
MSPFLALYYAAGKQVDSAGGPEINTFINVHSTHSTRGCRRGCFQVGLKAKFNYQGTTRFFKTQLTERVLRELIDMELKARVLCGVFVLLVSMCYLCEARWIDKTDQGSISDIDRNAQLLLNDSGNATNLTGRFAPMPKESDLLRIIINAVAGEKSTVVYNKTILVERNKVVTLNFTRQMLSSFNDIANTPDTRGDIRMAINHIQNQQLQQYKSATIGLAVLCAVMFLALAFITLRSRAKRTSKKPDDDTSLAVAKQTVESEYQSIRGLPRRETGNSYGYETVKPKLPSKRPPLAHLIQPNGGGEYENLKPHDRENLKTHVRESNPYMSMDEALAGSGLTGRGLTGSDLTGSTESSLTGSGLTGSVVALSGGDEDLYLTMKKLIRTPDEMAAETNESASI